MRRVLAYHATHQLETDAFTLDQITALLGRWWQAICQEALQQPPPLLQLHRLRPLVLFLLQAKVTALSSTPAVAILLSPPTGCCL